MNRIPLSFFGLAVLVAPAAPTAIGQQHEIGILAGATMPSAQISVASLASVSGGASATVQVSYAFRVVRTGTSSLYIELPVSRVAKASVALDENGAGVSASQVFFTPGLRWNFLTTKRVSPYLSAGAGLGWFDSAEVRIDPSLEATVSSGLKPVIACGGGVAFRMTRFMSLRVDFRDYIAAGTLVGNRNHLVYSGGIGFVF